MVSRIRTRSSPVVTRDMFVTRDCGSYWPSCDSGLHRTFSYTPLYESMEDVVTLEFERKRNEGKIVNSPMEKTSILWDHTFGKYHANYSQISGISDSHKHFTLDVEAGFFLPWTLIPTVEPLDEAALIDLAVTKAHANRSVEEFQALVTAAEAQQTVSSMHSILGRIFRILKDIKRLDSDVWTDSAKYLSKRRLKKELSVDELQDRYLEARYAIRPLIYDFEQAANAWNSQLPNRQTSRGFASDATEEHVIDYHSDHYSREHQYKASKSIVTEVRAGVLDELRIETLEEFLSVWGMDSFASSAWERVPFSFITDWFFTVGDTIAAWAPQRGLTKLASWYSLKRVTTERIQLINSFPILDSGYWDGKDDVKVYTTGGPASTRVTTYKKRVPDPDVPALPMFDLNVDTLKIVDLLAIARKSLLQ